MTDQPPDNMTDRQIAEAVIDLIRRVSDEPDHIKAEVIADKLTQLLEPERLAHETLKQELVAIQTGIRNEFTIGEPSNDVLQDFAIWIEHHQAVEKELKDTKGLLAMKNDTANTFMNQVKKLQVELQEWKDILARRDKHIVDQSNEIVKLLTNRDSERLAAKEVVEKCREALAKLDVNSDTGNLEYAKDFPGKAHGEYNGYDIIRVSEALAAIKKWEERQK